MSNGSLRAYLTEQAKSLFSVDFILVRAGIEHDTIYLYIIASCFYELFSPRYHRVARLDVWLRVHIALWPVMG